MSTAKQAVASLLNKLPDDCSLEDIQYHLYVLQKIQRAIESASSGTRTQRDAEQQLRKWLSN